MDVGLGAALLQDYDDEGKLFVSYANRKFLPREKTNSEIEKECLAIVWGIEHFHRYIFGTEFVLETDDTPLSYLQTDKVLNPRGGRCVCNLSDSVLLQSVAKITGKLYAMKSLQVLYIAVYSELYCILVWCICSIVCPNLYKNCLVNILWEVKTFLRKTCS